MKIGIIGLGKMGNVLVYRLKKAHFEVVGFDPQLKARTAINKYGASTVSSIEMISAHARIIWLMVPAGAAVDAVLKELEPHLKKGDIIIDGGNSYFKDSIKHAQQLKKREFILLIAALLVVLQVRKRVFP